MFVIDNEGDSVRVSNKLWCFGLKGASGTLFLEACEMLEDNVDRCPRVQRLSPPLSRPKQGQPAKL